MYLDCFIKSGQVLKSKFKPEKNIQYLLNLCQLLLILWLALFFKGQYSKNSLALPNPFFSGRAFWKKALVLPENWDEFGPEVQILNLMEKWIRVRSDGN